MNKHKKVVILISFIAGLTMCASTSFAVDKVSCKNSYGTCTVDQAGYSCLCKAGPADGGGSTGGSGGTPEIPPKTEEELQTECKKHLAVNCGSDEPIEIPGQVSCENDLGSCSVGQNSFSCECAGGEGTGGGGGASDTGGTGGGPEKTKEELLAECEEMLTDMCGDDPDPPEGSVKCEDENGICTVGQFSFGCECKDGSGDGGGGGTTSGDTGTPEKSEEELLAECKDLLASSCSEGGSNGGESGADTTTGEGDGGESTAGASSTTDGGASTGDTGDSGGSSTEQGTTTEEAEGTGAASGTGVSDGGDGEGASGTDAGAVDGAPLVGDGTTGDAGTSDTGGTDAGATDSGGSSSGCVVGGSSQSSWVILLSCLALILLWRRRDHTSQLSE